MLLERKNIKLRNISMVNNCPLLIPVSGFSQLVEQPEYREVMEKEGEYIKKVVRKMHKAKFYKGEPGLDLLLIWHQGKSRDRK